MIDDSEIFEGKPEWKPLEFEQCERCDGDLEAKSAIKKPEDLFYDEDPVRCRGKCLKIVGSVSCDGESAWVSYL